MSGFIASMLRFRALVVALAAGLLVAGVAELRKAPVDVLPEYSQPSVQVQTEALGLSAAEVEQLMTVPLEQDLLNGVKGVDTIRSDSIPGLSSITLLFERGTDILRARQLVSERLSQPHAFPTVGSAPQMIQPVSSTSRVMMITLSSRRLTPVELSVLARWTVRPRLMGIPGVANVAIWGHRDRQLQVLVDPARLRANHVSLLSVVRTAGNAQLVSPLTFLNASTPGTGGFLDGPNQRLGVRHILPFAGPSDLGQVPVEDSSAKLSDVATVVEDHPPLIGDAVAAGAAPDDALQLVVEKLPGTNTLALTRRLDDALREMGPGLAGVTIDSSAFRPASFIETALDHLRLAAIIAAALVRARARRVPHAVARGRDLPRRDPALARDGAPGARPHRRHDERARRRRAGGRARRGRRRRRGRGAGHGARPARGARGRDASGRRAASSSTRRSAPAAPWATRR